MKEQSFSSITIQGIAARAGVNRATFYSHFEDKYDLLNAFVREGFQEWVSKRVSSADGFSRARLRLLVATVFEFLAEVDAHCAQATQLIEPMFESAVQRELNALLLSWLRPVPPEILPAWHLPERAALVWSWAIFGAGSSGVRKAGTSPPMRWPRSSWKCSCPKAADPPARALLGPQKGAASGVFSAPGAAWLVIPRRPSFPSPSD